MGRRVATRVHLAHMADKIEGVDASANFCRESGSLPSVIRVQDAFRHARA